MSTTNEVTVAADGDAATPDLQVEPPKEAKPVVGCGEVEGQMQQLESDNEGLKRSKAELSVAEDRLATARRQVEDARDSGRQLTVVNAYLCQRATALETALRQMGVDPTAVVGGGRGAGKVSAELRAKAMLPASGRAPLTADEVGALAGGGKAQRKRNARRHRGKSENEVVADRRDSETDGLGEEGAPGGGDRRRVRSRLHRRREANRTDVLIITDCYSRATLRPPRSQAAALLVKVKPLRCERNLFDAITYISHARDWQPLRCVVYVVGGNDLRLVGRSAELIAGDAASLVETTRSLMPSTYVLFCAVNGAQPPPPPPPPAGDECAPPAVDDELFAERAAQFNRSMRVLCEASPMLFFVADESDAVGDQLLESLAAVYTPLLEEAAVAEEAVANGRPASPPPAPAADAAPAAPADPVMQEVDYA